jgi:hypothetical protein
MNERARRFALICKDVWERTGDHRGDAEHQSFACVYFEGEPGRRLCEVAGFTYGIAKQRNFVKNLARRVRGLS